MAEGGKPDRDDEDEGRDQERSSSSSSESEEQGRSGQGDESEKSAGSGGDDSDEGEEAREEQSDESDESEDEKSGDGGESTDDKTDDDASRDESDGEDSGKTDSDDDSDKGDDSKDEESDEGGRSKSDPGDEREMEQEGESEGRSARKPDEDEDEEEQEDEEGEKREPPGPVKSILLGVAVVVFVILGFLLFSAAIAPTYIWALILAVVWFVIAYLLIWRFILRKRRHLGPVIVGAFALIVVAIALWLGISTLTSTTAHEQVVTGRPITKQPQTAKPPRKPKKPAPPRNTLIETGNFKSAGAGSASGTASIVNVGRQQRQVLTITGLNITPGPTQHVLLAPGDGTDTSHALDLGDLKGNKGNQQYPIPPDTDTDALHTVVINSSILSVAFARAQMGLAGGRR